jgi:hypothetical protein
MVPDKWISGIPRKLNLFGKLMFTITSVEFYGIPFANLCGISRNPGKKPLRNHETNISKLLYIGDMKK